MEYIPYEVSKAALFARRNKYNTWTERTPSKADSITWHLRMGHPGPEALNHLVGHSKGVCIKGIPTVKCDECAQAKAKSVVRREPRERPEQAGTHLAIDFHDYEKGINGYSSVMLVTDRYSGYIWDFYLENRESMTLIETLWWLFRIFDRQYKIKPKVIQCDNELMTSQLKHWITVRHGIKLEPSAPNTQSQNGGAERSGGVVKVKARAMRQGAKLPDYLWPEIVRTAIYLYNRTPKYLYHWKSPYELFFTYLAFQDGVVAKERKPKQTHLRVFGCKAFALTSDAKLKKKRLQRLNPRAWIGYLVGYNSTNIYRIWNPRTNRVVAVRDVTFNEAETFSGDIQDLKDDLLHISSEELETLLRTVEVLEPTDRQITNQNEDEDLSAIGDVNASGDEETASDGRAGYTRVGNEESMPYETDHLDTIECTMPYLTPETSPPPQAALLVAAIRDSVPYEVLLQGSPDTRAEGLEKSGPHSIDPRFSCWRTAFNAGRLVTKLGTINGETVSKAGLVRSVRGKASYPSSEMVAKLGKGASHRKMLPPLPKTHRDLRGHPFEQEFREAEKAHLKSHEELRTWRVVPRESAKQKQILDCMWVYVYKFNKHGYLKKCKARLVVRGDQQAKSAQENTYASTLAGRSFRSLMAIAARFDLELIQFDVVNAFVNADLNQEVYMRQPPGYRSSGMIVRLQKALYGLREAPLLWQKYFTDTLYRFGFRTIPHEPCCLIKDGLLIFFYVDDIVLAYEKKKELQAAEVSAYLKRSLNLTGGNCLQWFLGIEIIRDRKRKLIWLSQASYIDKISKLAEPTGTAPKTPMRNKELLPYEGRASYSSITQYQKKIGSILYAAVITRIDIAFTASRLARFSSNPSQEHHNEADRTIRYLAETRTLALQLGGGDTFEVASDASFADNTLDRTSSQAYVMKLFGGTIGWRANKQDTVTTSTTEAELLSLAQAAKEAMFVSRLVRELGVTLDNTRITLQCDNQQTIRLINADIALLRTKLRHIDIHNHWLQQEAIKGKIQVVYTPTDKMIADGLTKVLPVASHQRFVRQIGLVDISKQLKERQLKELSREDLDKIEDALLGGEAEVER